MDANKINKLAVAFGIAGVLAFIGTGAVYIKLVDKAAGLTAVAAPEGEAGHPEDEEAKEEGHGEEGHGEEEASDLDRPVDEMWALSCEHKIPTYQCDECRYEVGVVRLPSDIMQSGGGIVKTAKPSRMSFSEELSVTGEVGMNEEKTSHATSPLSGVLKKVYVSMGDRVEAGSPLFELDSHDVSEARSDYLKSLSALEAGVNEASAEYRKALSTLDLAQKSAEREKQLFEKNISAKMEVEEANARLAEAKVDLSNARSRLSRLGFGEADIDRIGSGTDLKAAALPEKNGSKVAEERIEVGNSRARLLKLGVGEAEIAELTAGGNDLSGVITVRAPTSGVVFEKHGAQGEFVEAGTDLVQITNLSEIWVWANLKEQELAALRNARGEVMADVEFPGGRIQRGRVDLLAGTVDEETRYQRARIVLPNPGTELRPGMFVTVKVLLPGKSEGLAVPKAAVLSDEGRPFVFVHKEKEYWVRRPVVPGKEIGGQVEILEGLAAGQTILTDGSFVAKSDVLRSKMGAGCAD